MYYGKTRLYNVRSLPYIHETEGQRHYKCNGVSTNELSYDSYVGISEQKGIFMTASRIPTEAHTAAPVNPMFQMIVSHY